MKTYICDRCKNCIPKSQNYRNQLSSIVMIGAVSHKVIINVFRIPGWSAGDFCERCIKEMAIEACK